MIRTKRESATGFASALDEEDKRASEDWLGPMWLYRRAGLYYEQLTHHYDAFDREQIKVLLYDDIATHPVETVQEVFGFLGVDGTFVPDVSTKRNVGGHVEHADPAVMRRLTASFRHDVLKLQDLIDRDLSSWLEPPP
jgi:hypothetical protein